MQVGACTITGSSPGTSGIAPTPRLSNPCMHPAGRVSGSGARVAGWPILANPTEMALAWGVAKVAHNILLLELVFGGRWPQIHSPLPELFMGDTGDFQARPPLAYRYADGPCPVGAV